MAGNQTVIEKIKAYAGTGKDPPELDNITISGSPNKTKSERILDAFNSGKIPPEINQVLFANKTIADVLKTPAPGSDPIVVFYAAQGRPQIYLDCDIDSDIDDVLDLILLLNLERRKECDIIGISVSSANADAAGCLYAILNYYGRTAIPVGASNATGTSTSAYTTATVATYGVAGHTAQSDFPSTVTNYRTVLANAPDNSVVILTTGALTSVNTLVASAADTISPLNGSALVQKKVRAIFPTAGYWPSGAGVSDFGGAAGPIAASQTFLSTWPSQIPVVFNGIENGDTWSSGADGSIFHLDSANPARAACTSYMGALSATSSRNAWSPTAILGAVRGLSPYVNIQDRGTGSIDGGTGATSWVSSASGPHGYLRKLYTDTQLTDLVNSIISVDPITWPAIITRTDPDANNLIQEFIGPLHDDAIQLIYDFVVGTKADGDWNLMSRLHVHAMGNEVDSAMCWKTRAYATFSGAYTFKMWHGIHGDGATGKIDYNFDPTNDPTRLFSQNNNHVGIVIRVGTGLNAVDFGNTQFAINSRSVGGNFSSSDSHTASASQAGVGDARRHRLLTRTVSGTYKRYRDAVADSDVSQASQALLSASFYGLGQNNAGVLTTPTTNRPIAAAHWGSGAISTNIYNRLRTLLRGLGSLN